MTQTGAEATDGTTRFAQHHAGCAAGHFRPLAGRTVSSIGLGTYLGDPDEATDRRMAEALRAAIAGGLNLVDTAINYRCQRSERVIGRTLAALQAEHAVRRDELVICTKGGYLPFDGATPQDPMRYALERFIAPGVLPPEELVAGCHSLSPTWLRHVLGLSLRNLALEAIDIYYLHNPEEQRSRTDPDTFTARMTAAFRLLEEAAEAGQVRVYGIATWHGLRRAPGAPDYLDLAALVRIAERLAGARHHFRAVQVPYNLAMPEAAVFANQSVNGTLVPTLEAATRLGLAVVTSASLLQGQLARLPGTLARQITGLATAAQRAVQFARSTPGVTTALVGTATPAHVEELAALARQPGMTADAVAALFDRTPRKVAG